MTTSSSTGTKLTDRVSDDARTRLAAIIAVADITWFLLGVAVLHVAERSLNPARHMVSE